MPQDHCKPVRKTSRYQWLIDTIDALEDDLTKPWNAYPCLDWPWKSVNWSGYGTVHLPISKGYSHGQSRIVTRVVFEHIIGPLEGLCALHRCDRRLCFRPIHLFKGTRYDNNKDAAQKGRSRNRTRESHNLAKMNWEKVELARKMRREGRTIMAIAKHFGLVFSSTRSMLIGETWKPE